MNDCSHRDEAGAWVLDALDDDDATAFATHLETCAACRREVAELRGVADVLPMAAPQVVPPPALKSRIMAVVESEAQLLRASGPAADRPEPAGRRRLRRPWWESVLHLSPVPLAALASVLLALGVGTGLLISGSGDDAVTTATRTGFGPHGARVALRVSGDHGRLVLRRMPAPPQGRVYQVWILKGNHPVPTHSLFTVPRDGQAEVDISESLKGADKVLVTDEPAGGSMQPTTQPVAGATLT